MLNTLDTCISHAIFWLQIHTSAELLTVILFLMSLIAILILLRLYGAAGLYVYNTLAIVIANIHVLRMALFQSFEAPVALGTALFTTTFFVNDLLTEHYGPEAAKRCIGLGFWAQILTLIWMMLALGHPLVAVSATSSPALKNAESAYQAMLLLFTPSLRLFAASLLSYWCSQWVGIALFTLLRRSHERRGLWLRQNLAMLCGGVLDTFLFSALAWRWLSPTPFGWTELFFAFVLSAQIIRALLGIAATPFMYLSYACLPRLRIAKN